MNKRLALGIGAGVAAFAAVTASAASLGGVNAAGLGADTNVVASCDTDGVSVDYTTGYVGTEYKVTAVKLSGVAAACNGKAVAITLRGASGSLGEVTGTRDTSTTQSFSLGTAVSASSVTGVAVVIAG